MEELDQDGLSNLEEYNQIIMGMPQKDLYSGILNLNH